MKDLGWANDWKMGQLPEAVKKCRKLNHERSDIDVGPPNRGIEHVVRCDRCQILYRYDSSD